MIITFVSNYYNHHQHPLCQELSGRCEEFFFISTSVMREDRRQLGYGIEEPDYVIHGYEEEYAAKAMDAIRGADVIVCGAARGEFSDSRLYRDKVVFYYSERLYKTGCKCWQLPLKAIKYHRRFELKQRSFLLCSGAYTASDFRKTGTFRDRCYQWGYFPKTEEYDIQSLMNRKDRRKLLWCGRLLDWKHPEYAVEIARRLKAGGIPFSMDMIGIGPEEKHLKELINSYGLAGLVQLTGSMKPEQVRERMENAGVFLFTSDRQEGWGAVLNEAMNSGCAVAVSHLIGSAPYLIKNKQNGYLFKSGDINMLYDIVAELLEHPDVQEKLGTAAYTAITGEWNERTAAERFVSLANAASISAQPPELFEDGPCAKAPLTDETWFIGE